MLIVHEVQQNSRCEEGSVWHWNRLVVSVAADLVVDIAGVKRVVFLLLSAGVSFPSC